MLVPYTQAGYWRTFSLQRAMPPLLPALYYTSVKQANSGTFQYDVRGFELH